VGIHSFYSRGWITIFEVSSLGSSSVFLDLPVLLFPLVAEMLGYQLSPFEVGQVKAHMYHGLGAAAISRIILKRDGKSHWGETAIQRQIDILESSPSWKGDQFSLVNPLE
jgi:hypothetical protein